MAREACLAAASRYLAVWLFTSQLTPAIPSRKQPETANIITLADRSAAVQGITATIEVDGKRFYKGRISCVLAGNVGKVLGGVEAFSAAEPDDGLSISV